MNVLRIIRRALWSIVLATCIVIGCTYLALSQLFLTSAGLTQIIRQSTLVETIRTNGLLPRVLSVAQSSPYAGLLDGRTVTDAFNASVTNEALTAKLAPAIESLSLWLNSKEPSVNYTIDTADLSRSFADQLVARLETKIDSLPACTPGNTLSDIENGICRSPLVPKSLITQGIRQTIQSRNDIVITPETLPALSSNNQAGSSLPSYLNILYSISLVAAAVIGLVSIWLLFKHRLAGIITAGVACILAAVALYGISVLLTQATITPGDNQLIASIIPPATQSLRIALQQQALWLSIGGTVAIAVATVPLVILNRRRKTQQTMHLSSDPDIRRG